eukprot:324456_1
MSVLEKPWSSFTFLPKPQNSLEKYLYWGVTVVGACFILKVMIDANTINRSTTSWGDTESIIIPYRNSFHVYLPLSKILFITWYKYRVSHSNTIYINGLHALMLSSDILITFWFARMNYKYSLLLYADNYLSNDLFFLYANCFLSNALFMLTRFMD